MAQIFVGGGERMAFDGACLLAVDAAAGPGTSYEFGAQRVVFNKSDNNDYPELIDAAGFPVNKAPGVRMGQLQISGVVQPDRAWHTFLNTAFGPRTAGQLPPWLLNLIPYAGGAPIGATGVWWNTIRIFSAFGIQGGQQMVFFVLSGMVFDPDNFYNSPALALPAYAGTAGAGIAAFSRASFTNDGATTYDDIRSFDMTLTNRMVPIPAMKNSAMRISKGAQPRMIMGSLGLGQLKGAASPVPLVSGNYPLDIILPTGDATHALKLATQQSYDADNQTTSPTDFNQFGASYTLFSGNGAYPFVASYA